MENPARAVKHSLERDYFSNLTKALEELDSSEKKIISFLLPQGTRLYHGIHDGRRIYERSSRDALARHAHVGGCTCENRARLSTWQTPPHLSPTCPHSACPCTRNGALLPSPPTTSAGMHVPAHMTTPYSRIFSSQWL